MQEGTVGKVFHLVCFRAHQRLVVRQEINMKFIDKILEGPAGLLVVMLGMTLAGGMAGCTNASVAKFTALGRPANITCYSGGKVILSDRSTGKISSESESDGWYYQSAKAFPGKLVRVSGQCVVSN